MPSIASKKKQKKLWKNCVLCIGRQLMMGGIMPSIASLKNIEKIMEKMCFMYWQIADDRWNYAIDCIQKKIEKIVEKLCFLYWQIADDGWNYAIDCISKTYKKIAEKICFMYWQIADGMQDDAIDCDIFPPIHKTQFSRHIFYILFFFSYLPMHKTHFFRHFFCMFNGCNRLHHSTHHQLSTNS